MLCADKRDSEQKSVVVMARGKQGEIAKFLQEEFLDYLEEESKKLLEKAMETADFQNRTYNLFDSYGYGIYLNGSLKRSSVTSGTNQKKATQPRKWYDDELFGRQLAEMAFEKRSTSGGLTSGGYAPSGKRGFVIVLAATMPYAVVLEAGGYRRKVLNRGFDKFVLHPSIYKKHGDFDVAYKRKYHVITQIVADCEQIGQSLIGKSLVSHVDLKRYDFLNNYQ